MLRALSPLWSLILISYISVFTHSEIAKAEILPGNLIYAPQGMEKLRTLYELAPFIDPPNLSSVKIAVLDKVFGGVTQADIGKYLPDDTVLVETYPGWDNITPLEKENPQKADEWHSLLHGIHMAQIAWGLTGLKPKGKAPKFRLYNANGPENEMAAIQSLIDWGAHIVIQSMNFEMFGNMNGTGFIDEHVEHAKSKGVIWLNTVGNYRDLVSNHPILVEPGSEFVTFSDGSKYLRFSNTLANNSIRVVLNYNRYNVGNPLFKLPKGTNDDLDLYVGIKGEKDDLGNQLWRWSSTDNQVEELTGKRGETLYAREVVSFQAPNSKEDFLIAVKRKSGNYNPDKDRLRIVVYPGARTKKNDVTNESDSIFAFHSATKGFEVMIPGDGVGLTVSSGGSGAALGPTLDHRGKPEMLALNNEVLFSDDHSFEGESASNAIIGGITALFKGHNFKFKQEHLLKCRSKFPEKIWSDKKWKKNFLDTEIFPAELVTYLKTYFTTEDILGQIVDETQNRRKTLGLLNHTKGFRDFKVALRNNPKLKADFKNHRIWLIARTVSGTTYPLFYKTTKKDAKLPWDVDEISKEVVGAYYYELLEVEVPRTPFVGELTDNTQNDPRFFKAPASLADLNKIVSDNP